MRAKLRIALLGTVGALLVLGLVLPGLVWAQPPDFEELGGLYIFRLPRSATDLHGTSHGLPATWAALQIVGQEDMYIYGGLYLLARNNVRGSRAQSDTATVVGRRGRVGLVPDMNYVDVVGNGTIDVYIPEGVVGYVSSGDIGVVSGSPVELAELWNEITITTEGDIVIWVVPEFEYMSDFYGVVGNGTSPRFMLYGPDARVAVVPEDQGGVTITERVHPFEHNVFVGDWHRAMAQGAQYTVSGAGEFSVYVPYGNSVNLSGSAGLKLDGEDTYDCDTGWNGPIDTGITTGVLHVNVETDQGTFIQGRVRVNSRTGAVRLRGWMEGYVVTGRSPYNAVILSGRFRPTWRNWSLGD